MNDSGETELLLWPTDAADPSAPPVGLFDLLAGHRLLVLGLYSVPDQTTPEQLRERHGEEATAAVGSVAEAVRERGVDAEPVVVFTRDRDETIDRVAAEHDVDAVLTPGAVDESITRVFVPIRGDENIGRIVSFVAGLAVGADSEVTLYNAADSAEAASRGEFLLRGATDRLVEEGIDRDRIEWSQERTDDAVDGILATATDHDLLVIGESKPSLRERILGNAAGQLVDAASQPVAVVRDA
jgi:nucleotide-binding universal stress UspA family protein